MQTESEVVLTVGLISGDLVNVDNPLLSVHLDNLSFASLHGTASNGNLIVLADGNSTDLSNNR